jgi:hypothetical protein
MATGSNTRNAGRGSSGLLPLSALLLAAAAAVAAQFAALAPEPYMVRRPALPCSCPPW